MAIEDTIRTVLGIIGNVISLSLFLSPVPTFYKVWQWKSTRMFSGIPYPYVATLLNCLLWVFYGIPIVHQNSILVATVNGTGVVLEVIYITMFIIYCKKDARLNMVRMLTAVTVFFSVVVVLTLKLAHTHERRSLIIGLLCVVFGTCMYASPLAAMRCVIKSKSVKYMPFPLSLASFSNGVIWTAYACIHFDIFVTIPNGLGALLGALQLILYGIYYRSTIWNEEEEMGVGKIEDQTGSETGDMSEQQKKALQEDDDKNSIGHIHV